jgi:hypothetical protein
MLRNNIITSSPFPAFPQMPSQCYARGRRRLTPSKHPYMVTSQFHPEFLSQPNRPHPLLAGMVKAAKEYEKK